jgi:hypothetical protein
MAEMAADLLTKLLAWIKVQTAQELLGLQPLVQGTYSE